MSEELLSLPEKIEVNVKHEVIIKHIPPIPRIFPDHIDIKHHLEITPVKIEVTKLPEIIPKSIVIQHQHRYEVDGSFMIMVISSIPIYFYSKRRFRLEKLK
jgi:hypothetical protein